MADSTFNQSFIGGNLFDNTGVLPIKFSNVVLAGGSGLSGFITHSSSTKIIRILTLNAIATGGTIDHIEISNTISGLIFLATTVGSTLYLPFQEVGYIDSDIGGDINARNFTAATILFLEARYVEYTPI